jgi:hypothetical protein
MAFTGSFKKNAPGLIAYNYLTTYQTSLYSVSLSSTAYSPPCVVACCKQTTQRPTHHRKITPIGSNTGSRYNQQVMETEV